VYVDACLASVQDKINNYSGISHNDLIIVMLGSTEIERAGAYRHAGM
jgi:hypothetical protein